MINFLKKIFSRKLILVVLILILGGGGYFGYAKFKGTKNEKTSYTTAAVEKGNIIVSVSGTGQVAVADQVEIKPEVSGKIVYLGVKAGQAVKAQTLLAQLDATDALKSVRDAKANLESAQLSLEKIKLPADELDIIKMQNTLMQAKEDKVNAETDLEKAYEDGYNDISDAFLDLPTLMAGLYGVLFNFDLSNNQWNIDYYESRAKMYDEQATSYADKAQSSYDIGRENYDENFQKYKDTSRSAAKEDIEALILQTFNTVKYLSEAVKNAKNLIDFYEDTLIKKNVAIPSKVATHQSSLETYTGTLNSHLSNLLSIKNTIYNSKESIVNAERTITEKEGDLADLEAGTDPLDIKSQELAVKQKENSLLDAQQKLADYYIRAPFDGIIAEASVAKGDSVSSGTAIATLITVQKIAEITLNEIDAAQVKVGQPATLTFDAVSDLTITGQVAEIDTLGTVSQGVVSYGVKIAFDVQDERIKPGMSLSVSITVKSARDVLTAPLSAVKSSGETSYVQILVNSQPQRKTVTTGLSNDTSIEIKDGLTEGEQIITQTISGSSTSATNSNSGRPNQGGNMFRMIF